MAEKNTGNQFIIDDVTREITVDLGADGITGLVNKESNEEIGGVKNFKNDSLDGQIAISSDTEVPAILFNYNDVGAATILRAQGDSGDTIVVDLPQSSGTVALVSDIPSVTTPTLQQVTDEGSDTSNTLTIYGANSAAVRFANADQNNILFVGTDESAFGVNNNDGVAYIYGSGKFHVATSSQRRLTVDGSGNVGINTQSPTEKLHVAGNIKAENALFDGNLEINGTSTLNGNATVNGDADVTGNLDVGTNATVGGQLTVGEAPAGPTNVIRRTDFFAINSAGILPPSSSLTTAYIDKPEGFQVFFDTLNIMVTKTSLGTFVQHPVTLVP